MTVARPSEKLGSLLGAPILIPFALLVVLVIWATGYGNARS